MKIFGDGTLRSDEASGLNWAISFVSGAIIRCFGEKKQIFIAGGHF
jgi:hypothetical protein